MDPIYSILVGPHNAITRRNPMSVMSILKRVLPSLSWSGNRPPAVCFTTPLMWTAASHKEASLGQRRDARSKAGMVRLHFLCHLGKPQKARAVGVDFGVRPFQFEVHYDSSNLDSILTQRMLLLVGHVSTARECCSKFLFP